MDGGVKNLNYHNFEYESASKVFDQFENVLGKSFWKGKDVCDFGCGAGGKSLWIKENGAKKVVGLDISEKLIDQAKDYCKKEKNIEFYVQSITSTAFEDNSFDVVVANDLIEHVDNPKKMLEEAYRILKKGGIMCADFEPYYHFLGHHMWDALTVPWAHVFFSEKTRILVYKKLVSKFVDGQDRVDFRVSKDENGREYIGYLNHITLKQFEKILSKLSFLKKHFSIIPFSRFPFSLFSKIPFFREFFTKKVILVLEKKG